MSSTAGPDDKTTRHAAQDDATTRPVTAVRHDDPVRDAPVRDVDPVREAPVRDVDPVRDAPVRETVHDTVVEEIPTRETVVAREKEQFGGIKVGSAFFGWLTATGMAVLLTALVAAGGTAVGLATNTDVNDAVDQASSNQTVGLTGIIVLLVILLVAYYCGGYVAGRMARFNGAKQGFMVWIWALIAAIVVAVLGLVAGQRFNILANLNSFPRIPINEGELNTLSIIAAIVVAAVALVGAVLGGLAGMRFHRKVDRAGFSPAATVENQTVRDTARTQPGLSRAPLAATASAPEASAGNDAIYVVPAPVHPHKAAAFVVQAPFALVPVVGHEFHSAFAVQRAAAAGGEDVQSSPLHAGVKLQLSGPSVRVPGPEQVPRVPDHEGAVPGAHELLRRRRLGVPAMEPAAAVHIRLARQARAVPLIRRGICRFRNTHGPVRAGCSGGLGIGCCGVRHKVSFRRAGRRRRGCLRL